ncbi:hypothetical protein TNCV_2045851 [Trichonephila clavipes]|uniref:Uncharacterized protein n=1 Tax=Trichonephila clavipes TaxID=2585209 RepID=A0A8X6SQN9_TRICX|nr:hypothetical protein TNCV_2045851 [Trichonephila clavipes]
MSLHPKTILTQATNKKVKSFILKENSTSERFIAWKLGMSSGTVSKIIRYKKDDRIDIYEGLLWKKLYAKDVLKEQSEDECRCESTPDKFSVDLQILLSPNAAVQCTYVNVERSLALRVSNESV